VNKLMSMLPIFWVEAPARLRRATKLWLLLALLPLQSGAAPLEAAQVIDALEPGWRVPMTLSQDGQRVAYCVMQPSRKQPMLAEKYYRSQSGVFAESVGTDIYLADAQGSLSNLTQGQGSNFAPVFSPDGRRLAFVSDRDGATRLWLWEDGKLRCLSQRIVWLGVGWNRPVWTHDGRSLMVPTLPAEMGVLQAARWELGESSSPEPVQDERQLPVQIYQTGQASPSKESQPRRFVSELTQISLSGGQPRRLAENVLLGGYWVSPDDRYLAYTSHLGLVSPLSQMGSHRLNILELASGRLLGCSQPFPSDFASGVSWSPDSQSLAHFTMTNVNDYEQTEVFITDLQGQSRRLAAGPYFQQTRGPAWLDPGRLALRSSSEVAVVSTDGSLKRLPCKSRGWVLGPDDQPYRSKNGLRLLTSEGAVDLNLETGQVQSFPGSSRGLQAVSGSPDCLFQLQLGPTGHQLCCTRQGSSQLIHLFNPQYRADNLGKPRLLEYGDLRAAMLMPPDYDPQRRYPVVFVVYGGDMGSRWLNAFGLGDGSIDNYHLLASRGYIVVRPDLPIDEHPVADIVKNVERAVDAVLEQGYGDPDRLAVMGHSYGHYSTLAVITRCHRFRAAIARGGVSNLVNQYLRFDKGKASRLAYVETGQGNMHCTLWENLGRYLENSPVFALDQVQTPVLLVHGQNDHAASVEETGQVFVGLQRLGKKAIYLAYPGEGHWEATWTRQHQLDFCNRMLDFLMQCQVTPGPSWGPG
jgi:dipeptidyl aminopeptidase/acylaminoacyl peptidase